MNLYHFDDYLNVAMLHRNNYPLVLDISTPYEQVKMKKFLPVLFKSESRHKLYILIIFMSMFML